MKRNVNTSKYRQSGTKQVDGGRRDKHNQYLSTASIVFEQRYSAYYAKNLFDSIKAINYNKILSIYTQSNMLQD